MFWLHSLDGKNINKIIAYSESKSNLREKADKFEMDILCFSEDSLDIVRVESMLIEIRWESFQQMNGEIQQYRVSLH